MGKNYALPTLLMGVVYSLLYGVISRLPMIYAMVHMKTTLMLEGIEPAVIFAGYCIGRLVGASSISHWFGAPAMYVGTLCGLLSHIVILVWKDDALVFGVMLFTAGLTEVVTGIDCLLKVEGLYEDLRRAEEQLLFRAHFVSVTAGSIVAYFGGGWLYGETGIVGICWSGIVVSVLQTFVLTVYFLLRPALMYTWVLDLALLVAKMKEEKAESKHKRAFFKNKKLAVGSTLRLEQAHEKYSETAKQRDSLLEAKKTGTFHSLEHLSALVDREYSEKGFFSGVWHGHGGGFHHQMMLLHIHEDDETVDYANSFAAAVVNGSHEQPSENSPPSWMARSETSPPEEAGSPSYSDGEWKVFVWQEPADPTVWTDPLPPPSKNPELLVKSRSQDGCSAPAGAVEDSRREEAENGKPPDITAPPEGTMATTLAVEFVQSGGKPVVNGLFSDAAPRPGSMKMQEFPSPRSNYSSQVTQGSNPNNRVTSPGRGSTKMQEFPSTRSKDSSPVTQGSNPKNRVTSPGRGSVPASVTTSINTSHSTPSQGSKRERLRMSKNRRGSGSFASRDTTTTALTTRALYKDMAPNQQFKLKLALSGVVLSYYVTAAPIGTNFAVLAIFWYEVWEKGTFFTGMLMSIGECLGVLVLFPLAIPSIFKHPLIRPFRKPINLVVTTFLASIAMGLVTFPNIVVSAVFSVCIHGLNVLLHTFCNETIAEWAPFDIFTAWVGRCYIAKRASNSTMAFLTTALFTYVGGRAPYAVIGGVCLAWSAVLFLLYYWLDLLPFQREALDAVAEEERRRSSVRLKHLNSSTS